MSPVRSRPASGGETAYKAPPSFTLLYLEMRLHLPVSLKVPELLLYNRPRTTPFKLAMYEHRVVLLMQKTNTKLGEPRAPATPHRTAGQRDSAPCPITWRHYTPEHVLQTSRSLPVLTPERKALLQLAIARKATLVGNVRQATV